jgi:XTP/dITP diphosphohydrolase
LADDSGLEVDALAGEPGVHSARYAGDGASDDERIALLLRNLRDEPTPWTARFRCVIAIARPNPEQQHGVSESARTFDGRCEGEIVGEPKGDNGFGYDPVFFIPELGKTMAELTAEEKNGISHRSEAAALASEALKRGAVDEVS